MTNQQYRPSQIILTYGPGSVLETPGGPVVARSIQDLFRQINKAPVEFEIFDERLTQGALKGARITRIPANAELEVEDSEYVYPTTSFPSWSLCTRHTPQVMYKRDQHCPQCKDVPRGELKARAGREAIRFVRACPAGHLDDVDWKTLVHPGGTTCDPAYYLWHGGGKALRYIELSCPQCSNKQNFGQAYGRKNWRCSGRLPENKQLSTTHCQKYAQIIQRNATNLRLPMVVTALTIVNMPGNLYRTLSSEKQCLTIARLLKKRNELTRELFLDEVKEDISPSVYAELESAPWLILQDALTQLLELKQSKETSIEDAEFDALQHASVHGMPTKASAVIPGQPPVFEVNPKDVRILQRRIPIRVTPVSRLRIVHVQTSYYRAVSDAPDPVAVGYELSGQKWFPGVALSGEGIFLDLHEQVLPLVGDHLVTWNRRYQEQPDATGHPVYVWWHTLSHRLIRALALESGYSAASIRERVYFRTNSSNEPEGGVLLYTVQPGGDGTLGGLLALAQSFEDILDTAVSSIHTCSNDPVCESCTPTSALGAACYACLFISETSCAARNCGLDRILLSENMP